MKRNMRKHIRAITATTLLSITAVFAQEKEKDKNIGTEVVNVVKPYSPTLSDAFKIKETPSLDDSVTTIRKKINYSIYSVPVASTFTPAKGKAEGVQKAPKEKLYNTYVSLGLGNYSAALLDFYTSLALNRDEKFDVGLNHHSSQGGIEGVELKDNFFNTRLNASYKMQDRYMSWGADAGFQHQIYNWYGVPEGFYDETILADIDEKQTYYTANVGAHLNMTDAYFTGGDIYYRRFWDAFSSGENRAVLKPSFDFPVGDELVNLGLTADYISGKFDRNYDTVDEISYGNLLAGISPNLVMLYDDLTINLGASIFFKLDMEDNENQFYIYPNVTASYKMIEEYLSVYGGVEGKVIQNSYYDLQKENQFISPTLDIMPTDQQYDAFVGLKGKFDANISYNLRGSYVAANDQALFVSQGIAAGNSEGYAYGNSFDVIYDDIKTLSVFGEINVSVGRNFNIGVNAEVFDYGTDAQPYAWNLPDMKGSLFSDFSISEKWYGGVNLFYTGKRYDMDAFNFSAPISLDAYFDANAHLGYSFSEQLSAFVKANNITNNEYARWADYPVQGFQILAGATYKFDL